MSNLHYNVNRFSHLTEEINNAIVLALTRVISGEHLATTTTTTNYTAATSAAAASSSSYGVGPGWPTQHSPELRPSPLMGPHGVGMGMSSWQQGAGSSAGRDARKQNRYKGVRKRQSGKWGAEIRNKHKAPPNEWLGTYETEEEAAMAYDKAAIRLHGDRARLNFPLNRQNEPPEARDHQYKKCISRQLVLRG